MIRTRMKLQRRMWMKSNKRYITRHKIRNDASKKHSLIGLVNYMNIKVILPGNQFNSSTKWISNTN